MGVVVNRVLLSFPASRGCHCTNADRDFLRKRGPEPHGHPALYSHGVVAALLFGFEEAHGQQAARLHAQHQYDAADETGHVKLGLGELRRRVGLLTVTWRQSLDWLAVNHRKEEKGRICV